jgi:hypothetical protein
MPPVYSTVQVGGINTRKHVSVTGLDQSRDRFKREGSLPFFDFGMVGRRVGRVTWSALAGTCLQC